jgi:ribosomal protein S18 acetylase RimI-like enzyme
MNKAEINLREATLNDLKIVTQYSLNLHRHEDDGTIAPHQNFSSNLKTWLASELSNPRSLFLIAEIDNCPIGFIAATSVINDNGFLASPLKGVIQLLWVEQKHRKNQIAEFFVNNIEKCFKETGIDYVECNYTTSNFLAENFWKKQGYKKNSITARKFI